jgi:single-strand DNA-binding protein
MTAAKSPVAREGRGGLRGGALGSRGGSRGGSEGRSVGGAKDGARGAGSGDATDAPTVHVNEVRLRGRVSAAPEERELPSGDRLTTARLVIARPAASARQRQPIDVLECVAWTARAQREVAGWEPGSIVEVRGAVRRRFRRTPAGVTSRVEIEVMGARRVRSPVTARRAKRPGSRRRT